ncbi:MAG: thiamine phosphate synthase, partial [Gemmatimonadales bacterium]|nr:thiamine phosphate synthase [Gemmatimonadales bacterium]
MRDNVAAIVRLMLVTDDALLQGRDLVELARAGVRGGVTSVQLRLKHASAREQAGLARALVAAVGVPVLVNDRPDIALAAGAAGVHLGSEDLPIALVRRIVPAGFVIGASVGSDTEAANAGGADYWGIGPWRASTTKGDAGSALGPG